jgi:hypothetical protein
MLNAQPEFPQGPEAYNNPSEEPPMEWEEQSLLSFS